MVPMRSCPWSQRSRPLFRFGAHHAAATVSLGVSMRCAASARPGWARRGRPRRRGPPPGGQVDSIGMTIPEEQLKARGLSTARFDQALEQAAEGLLGLTPEDAAPADGPAHHIPRTSISGPTAAAGPHREGGEASFPFPFAGDLGAGFDPSLIRFRGRAAEAARLAAAAAPEPTQPSGAAGTPGAAPRGEMRSYRGDAAPRVEGAVAYVREGEGTQDGKDRTPTPTKSEAKRTVELDGGEKVTMAANRLTELRRTLSGVDADSHATVSRAALLEEAVASRMGEPTALQGSRLQRQRRRAAQREALQYGATRHPCLVQSAGCCRARGVGAGACMLREAPAVCCVSQMETGHCTAAQSGRCPWHHEEVGQRGAQVMLAESLFAGEGVDAEMEQAVGQRLAQGVAGVEAVLQVAVDLVVAALEGAHEDPSHGTTAADSALSAFLATRDSTKRQHALKGALAAQTSSDADNAARHLRLHSEDDVGEVSLVLDGGLALVAASAAAEPELFSCDGPSTQAELAAGLAGQEQPPTTAAARTAQAELEAMWAEAEAEEAKEEAREARRLAEAAEQSWAEGEAPADVTCAADHSAFIRDLRTLWASFFTVADEAEVRLSPLLTDWVLGAAAAQLSGPAQEQTCSHALFWDAMAHLLQARKRECDTFLAAPDTAAGPSHPLRWAPLCLLKDLLLVQRLDAARKADCDAAAVAAGGDAGSSPLTESFLDRTDGASTGARMETDSEAQPSMLLHLMAQLADRPAPPSAEAIAATPTAALHEEVAHVWGALHAVFLQLCVGLTQSPFVSPVGPAPPSGLDILRSVRTDRQYHSHAFALASFVQTPLIGLAVEVSECLAARFEHPLLEAAGWLPWSDAQMFTAYQSAVYTPVQYARHHLPILASSCEASLLNSMLLVTVWRVEQVHGLTRRGPLEDATDVPAAARLVPWLCAQEQRPHRRLTASLQHYVPVALGFLSALQDLGRAVKEAQADLQQDFRIRRQAHMAREEQQRHTTHTRKYNGRGTRDAPSADDEALHVPLMDRLLPHATVAVSAGATARLLRLLLEGGRPFRALRLGVSVARMTRLLRHAARQPLPRLVETEKTVHRMYHDPKTRRKRVDKVRVPTLKLVTANGEVLTGGDTEGAEEVAALGAVTPVGLVYQVDEAVVEEMARAGLRMGPAGAKLADGVRDDCVRGHVVDFTPSRCLPTPTLSDVLSLLTGNTQCTRAVPGHLLKLRGLGSGKGVHHERLLSSAQEAHPASFYLHRQIPPTPQLLEILITHTGSHDVARHHSYHRLFTSDVGRFASGPVVVARQSALCLQRAQWALQAKECVWHETVLALSNGSAAFAAWHDLRHLGLADTELLGRWAAPPTPEAIAQGRRGATAGHCLRGVSAHGPTSTEALKRMLRTQDGGAGDAPETDVDATPTEQRLSPKEERRRRQLLRNPLPLYSPEALLTHVAATVPAPQGTDAHAMQRLEMLWAACAGTLLGLPLEAVGGSERVGRLAGTTLAQAVAAAWQLDRTRGTGGRWMMRTWVSLLLSRAYQQATPSRAQTTVAAEKEDDGLPLSSARSPVVSGVEALFALQARLLRDGAADIDLDADTISRLETAFPERATAEAASPLWPLFSPLLSLPPSVRAAWLQETLVAPSEQALAWLVAHVDRQAPDGLASCLAWLDALATCGHEAAGRLRPLVAQDLLPKATRRK